MPVPLHLVRASHLNPIIQSMYNLSMPVDVLLEKSDINSEQLIDPAQLILEKKVWDFLTLAAEFQNMPYLSILITEQTKFSDYGDFFKKIVSSNNLYQALHLLVHEINLHKNNHLIWFEESGEKLWFCCLKSAHLKKNQWQAEQHILTLFCMLIEFYAGSQWKPKALNLCNKKGIGLEHSRFFKNADINLGQKFSAIQIEHELLQDRTLSTVPDTLNSLTIIPNSFANSLKLLLKQNYFGRVWLAENIAETLDISARTLKRRLQYENTSLRIIFDEMRFEQACDLLAQGIRDYQTLAEMLGYTHQNNFVRAFKRWTGKTPKEYMRIS